MKIELLDSFEGKHNVRHIINDNGIESWLTQEKSFGDEAYAKGACKLNTVENETKHVLFLFNSNDEEVGRYYIGKRLQGKTPTDLVEIKNDLVFFESFNPESKSWVPCVGKKLNNITQPHTPIYMPSDSDENVTSNINPCININPSQKIDKFNLKFSQYTKWEMLDLFQGKENVCYVLAEGGSENWFSQAWNFADEASAKGACKLNTVENETKHVLFLFNSNDEEVGRYYIGKKLQGKTPNQIIDLIDKMIVFEVWKPSTKCWIPCLDIYYEEKNNPKDIKSVKQEPSISSMGEGEKNNENRFDYTEEMFRNEQKQRDADEEEKKILKYGTTNQDLINKIEKDKKDNRSFWIFIIIIVLVMNIIMGGIAKCTGSKYDPFEDYDTEWQYKHPDKHY